MKATPLLGKLFRIDGLEDPENAQVVRVGLALALVAIAARIFFWVYTGRVWEDALITVLHSENFVNGLGLTHYNVGHDPVHGFTSPLSVLVPLIGDLVNPGYGLGLIRIVSALCGGVAVLYALAIAIHPAVRLGLPGSAMLMGYLALEHNQLLWGMSGMETQLVTTVLLMTAYYALAWKPIPLGIALGLCMLARPDLAFFTVVVGLYVLAKDWRQLPKVVAISVAIYMPWVVFTTLYYGSPIPNTIVAKSFGYPLWWQLPGINVGRGVSIVWGRISGGYAHHSIIQPLGPSFPGHGTGFLPVFQDFGLIAKAMGALALVGMWAAAARRTALIPAAGYVLVYGLYYVFLVPIIFGWYLAPFSAMTMLFAVYGLRVLGEAFMKNARERTAALRAVAVVYLLIMIAVLPKTITAEKRIQEDIENVVRIRLGQFLAEEMGPDETVGAECLGYFGYESRRTVYDWPGLTSPDVVEYSRTHPDGRNIALMLKTLQPDYIAVREIGGQLLSVDQDWLINNYMVLRHFQADPRKLKAIHAVERNIDTSFYVFKKAEGGAIAELERHRREAESGEQRPATVAPQPNQQ